VHLVGIYILDYTDDTFSLLYDLKKQYLLLLFTIFEQSTIFSSSLDGLSFQLFHLQQIGFVSMTRRSPTDFPSHGVPSASCPYQLAESYF
jgi:hypothetical protein